MNILKKLALGAAIAASFGSASATLVVGGSLQGVIDNLYIAGGSAAGTIDVNADQHAPDEIWQIGGTGGSVNTFVIQLGAYAANHVFGIYDITDPTKRLNLMGGVDTPGSQAFLSVDDTGLFSVLGGDYSGSSMTFGSTNFGYFLQVNPPSANPAAIYYSQSSLNGGDDHMVAYEGTGDNIKVGNRPVGEFGENEYILAFEDLPALGDQNYSDFVVLVESVNAVPEPGSLALVGLSLAGLGALSRRRRNA